MDPYLHEQNPDHRRTKLDSTKSTQIEQPYPEDLGLRLRELLGRVGRVLPHQLRGDRGWDYEQVKHLISNLEHPLVLVDLDIFDTNVTRLVSTVRDSGKTLRPASKSIRVPELLEEVFRVGGDTVQGVMCYSVKEAEFLASRNFDDLLVAYPTVEPSHIDCAWNLTQHGKNITLMVRNSDHLEALSRHWTIKASTCFSPKPFQICIDLDVSWRPFGLLHAGVQRSALRNVSEFEKFLDQVISRPELKLGGVMAYEAQIAGVADASPFKGFGNQVMKLMKYCSVSDVADKRQAVAEVLSSRGINLQFFNGGGTGSIQSTCRESWITEVTAGSGFLQSHLFDYYGSNQNNPAYCYALRITDLPQPDRVTCQSGGFTSSGPATADKAPIPFLPRGLKLTRDEGVGEVQTPLIVQKDLQGLLQIDDSVLFRPAKAGELAEQFNHYYLKRADKLVGMAKTYRGFGYSFK